MSLSSRPERDVLAIIATFTLLRLLLAATLGLGVDEAYTLSVAHDLELSYYDHPPLQYWIAHLFLPLLGDGRAARLPFIALFAASCWLLYRLTRLLFDEQAGVLAVLALNCSACFSFALGCLVLPDGPLMVALLAAALALARGLFPKDGEPPSELAAWLQAGAWLGVAALCKYHALLFAAGFVLFLLSVRGRRRLLLRAGPWLGGLLALAIAWPVILWNIRHQWISVGYQAGRGTGSGFHVGYVLANIAGQAIWMLPWIFVPMVMAAWRALRCGPRTERSWYCLCLALPTVAIFTLVPLRGHVGLPHWQMPGWLMLFPVLGEWAVRTVAAPRLRRWGIASAVAVVALASVIVAEAATGFGRLLVPGAFRNGDPTLEAFEWGQLPPQLAARGLLRPGTFVITSHWIYAGRIDQAFHSAVPVVVFGSNPKQFGLRYDPQSLLGRDALVIGPVDSMQGIAAGLRSHFDSIEVLTPLALGRSGQPEIQLHVLLARQLRTPLPAPYWRP